MCEVTAPFRLMDLPSESIDNMYAKIIENNPMALLSRAYRGKELGGPSRMLGVNKQMRKEFIGALYHHADITATVRDFDFRDLVTHLNAMDELDLHLIESAQASNHRRVTIKLLITEECRLRPIFLDAS